MELTFSIEISSGSTILLTLINHNELRLSQKSELNMS